MSTQDTANTAADQTAATGTAAAAPAAPKAPSKKELCMAIFRTMVSEGKTRQDILGAFKSQVGMTPDGASTYYANLQRETGLSGAKSVRAAKPTDGTAPAAGATTTRGKKTGGSTSVAGSGSQVTAAFAVVTVDNDAVINVQPMFSQVSAIRHAKTTAGSIAVAGVPTIGDAVATLNRLGTDDSAADQAQTASA